MADAAPIVCGLNEDTETLHTVKARIDEYILALQPLGKARMAVVQFLRHALNMYTKCCT